MPEPTPATRAVFLSYAREDTDAARRIADALRSQGVEVWFDQAELRGGEAWDAKIKKQIRDCALFLAVVSTHTQERTEGYFRREWKLAVERTADMAAGTAFLVPVVIDDTAEVQAVVPEEFMKVQWTRLPGALPTPDFVAQVKNLLTGGVRRKPTIAPMATSLSTAPMRTRPPLTPLPPIAPKPVAAVVAEPSPRKKSGRSVWISVVLLLVIGGAAAAFLLLRESEPPPPPPKPVATRKPATVAPAPPPEPVITDKSIAVLPFENLSADKENAFFADGVHEDILTNLAKIAELKVISRTSVMEYRGTTKKTQQIAKELGVAFVLEGSVRRAGNKVRVVCQLIDGKTGQHVLAPDPYDRDLADIFAIQSEVAQSIAAKLQAVLSPVAKAALERAPTANLTAYDLYLKAREMVASDLDPRTRAARRQPLLESALQYDSKFALAWHDLAHTHLTAYNAFDRSDTRAAQAKAALDKAVTLDPDNVSIVSLLANYYIDVRDLTRAVEQGARLAQLFPNHALTLHIQARLAVRQDRRAEALAIYRKARSLDPRNPQVLDSLGSTLRLARQYDEALAVMREMLEVVPDNLGWAYLRAFVSFDARGSAAEMEALLAKIPPEARRTDPAAIGRLSLWAVTRGDADEVIRLWEQSGPNWRVVAGSEQLAIATAFVVKGQPRKARPILVKERERLAARLASQPDDGNGWYQLAMTHALLGEKREALEVQRKMLSAWPAAAAPENSRQFNEVVILAWVGEKDRALTELARRLPTGETGLNVHRMRRSLFLKPLQGDPRFEAILNDPKNNAPLF